MTRCDICITEDCDGNKKCHCDTCKNIKKCNKVLRPVIRITRKCTQQCRCTNNSFLQNIKSGRFIPATLDDVKNFAKQTMESA